MKGASVIAPTITATPTAQPSLTPSPTAVIERTDDWARAVIDSKGRRTFDVQVQIGAYNDPILEQLGQGLRPGGQVRSSCFLFQYESDRAPDGHLRFPVMHLVNYDSGMDYRSWEPACIQSISIGGEGRPDERVPR